MRRGVISEWTVSVSSTRIFDVKLTIGKVHSIIVPVDQAAQVGLAPDQVKIRKEYGGGFPANVEGLHQLHCLVGVSTLVDAAENVFANKAHRIWSVNRCSTTTTITTAQAKGPFKTMTTLCRNTFVS